MAKQLDVVVIVSGDGDFIPLVEYLQHNGVIVEAVSFGRSTSGKLKEKVNNFIDLDDHPKVLMRIPSRRGSGGKSGGGSAAKAPKATLTGLAPAEDTPLMGFMPPRVKLQD
jgi:hypothetical protein